MLLMTLGIVSCQKEEQTFGNGKLRVRLERPQTKDGEKVSFDMSGFQWENGDQIRVIRKRSTGNNYYWGYYVIDANSVDNQQGQFAEFSHYSTSGQNRDITSNSAGVQGTYYVYYPANICALSTTDATLQFTYADRIIIPETQTSSDGKMHGFPMYGESDDMNVSFTNLCGILKLHLTGSGESVSSIAITTDASHPIAGTFIKRLNTENKYEIVTGTSSNEIVSNTGRSTVTLTCTPAQDISNGEDFFIYLPTGDYPYMSIKVILDGGRMYKREFRGEDNQYLNIARSCYTSVTFPPMQFPIFFTVDANGKKVEFSPGNLQYDIAEEMYQFASDEFTVIGSDNGAISSTSGVIDLFGWGTGSNPTNNSTTASDYSSFADWGAAPDKLIKDGTSGTYPVGLWKTLSIDEWKYLFETRNASTIGSTSNARFVKIKVGNDFGLVIFPDSYSHPTGIAGPARINDNSTTTANCTSYTLTEWSLMSAAGAVFLPITGYRNGSTYYSNNIGYYWSSDQGKCFYFSSGAFVHDYSRARNLGHGVRLVKDYTPSK